MSLGQSRKTQIFSYSSLILSFAFPQLHKFVLDYEERTKQNPPSNMRSTFSTSLFRQVASRRASSSFAARRFASQTSQSPSSSKQVQDALSVAQRLFASAGRVLGPLGERAAGLLGCACYSVQPSNFTADETVLSCSHSQNIICLVFVSVAFSYTLTFVLDIHMVLIAYRQPLIYNAEVARELLKQIYIAERLQPPTSFATITDTYSVLWNRARNPQYWRDLLTTGEWARVAVYAVEAYTIFKVRPFFVFISPVFFLVR